MIHMSKVLLSLAAVCLFSFSSLARAVTPAEAKSMPPGKIFDAAGLKPFKKGPNKVFVPGFKLNFYTKSTGQAYAGNVLGSGTAKAKMVAYLAGVDYGTMQAVADAAYEQFLTQLKDAGTEVVPLSAFKDNSLYKDLQAAEGSPYLASNDAVMVSPKGMPVWFGNYDKMYGGKGPFSADNLKAISKLSKELGAVAVFPTFSLSFVGVETSGHSAFAKRASVEMHAALTVEANSSGFWSYYGDDVGFGFFNKVWIATPNGGEPSELSSADNETLVKEMARMHIDLGPSASKKIIGIKEDPATYKTQMVETIGGATGAIVNGIKEAKK